MKKRTSTSLNVFREINGCLNWVIEQIIKEVKNQNEIVQPTQTTTNTDKIFLLVLPYKRKVGKATLKLLRRTQSSYASKCVQN